MTEDTKETFDEFLWREAEDGFVGMRNGTYAKTVKAERLDLHGHADFCAHCRGYVSRVGAQFETFNKKVETILHNRETRLAGERRDAEARRQAAADRKVRAYNRNGVLIRVWSVFTLLLSIGVGIFGIVAAAKSQYGFVKLPFILLGSFLIPVGGILSGLMIKFGPDKHGLGLFVQCVVTVWILGMAFVPTPVVNRYAGIPVVYRVSGGEATLYGMSEENAPEGEFTVESTYGGVPVTEIKKNAFVNGDRITSLILPDSLKIIETGALSGCSGLESLELPFVGKSRDAGRSDSTDTMTHSVAEGTLGYIFGEESFTGSYRMNADPDGSFTNVDLRDTNNPYYLPEALKKVTVRGGEIKNLALYGAYRVKEIELPKNITTIGRRALEAIGCASVTIPDSVEKLDAMAVGVNRYLTSVTLPKNLRTIGSEGFRNNKALNRIYFRSITPPKLEKTDVFYDTDTANLTFYVPRTPEAGDESIDYFEDWQKYGWAKKADWQAYDMAA